MLRSFALFSSALVLASCATGSGGGPAPQPVLEIVVFRVHDPASAETLRAAAHAQIATYPGFVRSLRLQALDDAALFADIVQWNSLAEAQAAMARAETDAVVQPFFAALGPLVSVGHYPLSAAAAVELLGRIGQAPAVEIAAYTVKDDALQAAAQPGLHEGLRSMPVVLASAPLKATDGGIYVDLIGWQSQQAHADTAAAMEKDPQGAAFVANVGEMKAYALFSVVAAATGR